MRGRYFDCDWRCPIHGIEVVKRDIAAGEARVIEPPRPPEEEGRKLRSLRDRRVHRR
jgi:hypothetical protein